MVLPKIGLRREALLFLPITALVLLALSAFTLFSYRRAIEQLTEQRHQEARTVALRLAARLVGRSSVSDQDLRSVLDLARGAAVLDEQGFASRAVGLMPEGNLRSPLDDAGLGDAWTGAVTVGPDPSTGPVVAAFAPVELSGQRSLLRVDLAAQALAAQRRTLKPLTWIVLGIDLALFVLLIQFLRHLLSPIDALMARARELEGAETKHANDEAAFLIETFDRALTSIRQSEEGEVDLGQLQKILGSVESGLLLLDENGTLLALNEVGEEVLGVQEPEEPRPAAEVLEGLGELTEILEACVEAGQGVQRAECTIDREGRQLFLGLTVHPLRRNDGSVRGWLILFADLTEVRERDRERQLSESLSRVGELTAGLAHELRNSLASLRGYLTLIERGGDDEALSDYLGEVRQEADHLYRVLQDFLSFAQPGSARMVEVDLVRLAHRAAADPALGGASVRVLVEGDSCLPTVNGDAELLERLLRNLLHNASRAQIEAGEDRAIQVRLSSTSDAVTLRVLDRGHGIPEELKERLFVPFSSGSPHGTGLGLALARRIAELHQARLTLENREQGGAAATLVFEHGAADSGRRVTEGSGPSG